ncbi:glutamate receptor ionotropic, kainate glr-3-like [Haliotis asinina]|uniref:glutamate receptor ionotropic, kainate glr-3-like n=1 Tax=Haliotis asinina TaxID=109174 RepID=UPI00353241C4
MFFQIHTFEQSLAGLIENTLQRNRIDIYHKLFNFVIFCDGIKNCLPRITNISSRKDKEHGQGTLLRHFSKWLFLNVDPPLLAELDTELDNMATAVKENNTSGTSTVIISTLLWKPNGRKWSRVGNVTNNGEISANFVAPLFPNTAYMLNGRKLKIAVLEWKPFCKKSATNGLDVYTQVCKDLFDSLGDYLNFTYELIEPADQSWGELSDTWSGLLGMVERNDVDLSGIPYGITFRRSKSFAFPYILYKSECEVVHRKLSTNDNHWMLLVSVFKWEVYVCGLLTMAWCIGLHTLLERYSVGGQLDNILSCPPSTSDHVMTALLVPLRQGSQHLPQNTSGRIFYESWWLFCIIIVAVYTGNLVAIMSVVKEKIPFNTIEELAENDDFKIIINKGSSHEDIYKYSNDSVRKKIWTKVLETRSASIQNSLDEDLHYKMLLQSGHYAYITGSANIDGIEKTVNNLRRMKCGTGPEYLSLPFPLNSPLVELFADKLIRLYDNGVQEAWARKWYTSKPDKDIPARTKASMSDLRSVWVMCGSGIVGALIILGVERFLNYHANKD